jgi:PAS domain S-box-containing protein
VFEEALEGIIIADARARIVGVNRAFAELTGCAGLEVTARPGGVIPSELLQQVGIAFEIKRGQA